MPAARLSQRLAAEALGTGGLLVAIVGSGIMGEQLAAGNAGVALLANSLATGCALWVLIEILAPISGAHFNPLVSAVAATRNELPWAEAGAYIGVQLAAALAGVALAHLMFDLPPWRAGTHPRAGAGQWLGECVAAAGLLLVVLLGRDARPAALPALIAVYITGAYWFTSSTSFANPAVTLARSATDSFSGIRPGDVPGFVGAQIVGALCAVAIAGRLRGGGVVSGAAPPRRR
ncbi:MAG: aquaporin [Casimicrobiaceae bacterium]